MASSQWPPPRASARPPALDEDRADERRPESDARPAFERILSELLRKGLDAGRGSFERVGETIAPKELAAGIVSQLGDLRSGIVRAVAQEVGRFLREADVATEVRRMLDGLGVEAKVELRYRKPAEEPSKAEPPAEAEEPVGAAPEKGRVRAHRSSSTPSST